jgi:hypothetical protein
MQASVAQFTKDKLKKMGKSGAPGEPPGSEAASKDSAEDYFGMKQAKGSNSARFARGGGVKKPHLGRMGRANGGKIPLMADNETETKGKKTLSGVVGPIQGHMRTDAGPIRQGEYPKFQRDKRIEATAGERPGRARGGKTGRGKTTVNVIVGRGSGAQPPPSPPPMPPPQAAPPPPPPRPPMPMMPPTGGMPPGMPPGGGGPPMGPPPGAAMGPAGAPPPGVPPQMRARGGRIANLKHFAHPPKAGFSDSKAPHIGGGKPGFSDVPMTSKRAPMKDGSADFGRDGTASFGKGGTPGQAKIKQRAGSGSGPGRLDNAAREA